MCCLGFATEQCDVDLDNITGIELATNVVKIDFTPKFELFIKAIKHGVSTELLGKANSLFTETSVKLPLNTSIEGLLAGVNDAFFKHNSNAIKKTITPADVEDVLIAGFKEAGYDLEFSNDPTPYPFFPDEDSDY
jgi:hypothetical protein